jgi:hypothetical protein
VQLCNTIDLVYLLLLVVAFCFVFVDCLGKSIFTGTMDEHKFRFDEVKVQLFEELSHRMVMNLGTTDHHAQEPFYVFAVISRAKRQLLSVR